MIIGVSMVRDEADVLDDLIRHMYLNGVDRLIIADNRSTDDTRDILNNWPHFVTVVDDPDPGYYQDKKMSALARRAYDEGATWVVPFDADEIWFSEDGRPLGSFLDDLDDVDVVRAWGFDHIRVASDDGLHRGPFRAICHRRTVTQKLPKVLFRAHPDARLHMGNHDVDRPGRRLDHGVSYRHFQYRSLEQFVRKVRNGREAYEASDLHWNYGTHWRTLGSLDDATLEAKWVDMMHETGLIVDPAPVRG